MTITIATVKDLAAVADVNRRTISKWRKQGGPSPLIDHESGARLGEDPRAWREWCRREGHDRTAHKLDAWLEQRTASPQAITEGGTEQNQSWHANRGGGPAGDGTAPLDPEARRALLLARVASEGLQPDDWPELLAAGFAAAEIVKMDADATKAREARLRERERSGELIQVAEAVEVTSAIASSWCSGLDALWQAILGASDGAPDSTRLAMRKAWTEGVRQYRSNVTRDLKELFTTNNEGPGNG